MKVALVNTNNYLKPPVIPIGLEYLVAPLERKGHEVLACDLAFSGNPHRELSSFIDEWKPEVIGFTVRNIDTVLFERNTFFLDEIAGLFRTARNQSGAVTVAGGTSTLCSRGPLREYLDADHLIVGPGELAFALLVEAIDSDSRPPPVVDGRAAGIIPDLAHPRGRILDYPRYLSGGNPAGLEFRKGCDWSCPFCIERELPVFTRTVEAVVEEARTLREAGARMLFLCDSEVNMDLEETTRLLRALADEELGLEWTGYFRPVPFNRPLASAAARSGLSSVTLSVNSWDLSRPDGAYGEEEVAGFCALCGEEGIKVAVDLLVGLPGEGRDSVERALDFMSRVRPSSVGVGCHIRLYENTPIYRLVSGGDAPGSLLGPVDDNPGLLRPAFYCGVDVQWLDDLISRDDLFFRSGSDSKVNYQRV